MTLPKQLARWKQNTELEKTSTLLSSFIEWHQNGAFARWLNRDCRTKTLLAFTFLKKKKFKNKQTIGGSNVDKMTKKQKTKSENKAHGFDQSIIWMPQPHQRLETNNNNIGGEWLFGSCINLGRVPKVFKKIMKKRRGHFEDFFDQQTYHIVCRSWSNRKFRLCFDYRIVLGKKKKKD